MTHNVYANTWQIASQSGLNKSIARFPDVCLSPPSPPAGPIPVPYPNTSFSTDLKQGSKTVTVGGKPAALAQKSYYQPSALGDEAATRTFGGSVITHTITGKTVFQSWSMDVKFEGKNVCRHLDLTTSNHNCPPPSTPPLMTAEQQTIKDLEDKKCPCCKRALHDWQKKDPLDPDSEALPRIKEDDFYAKLAKQFSDKANEKVRSASSDPVIMAQLLGEKHKDIRFTRGIDQPTIKDAILAKEKHYAEAATKLKALRDANPDCPNVSKPMDTGCGTHFDLPQGEHEFWIERGGVRVKQKKTYAERCKDDFSDADRKASFKAFEEANPNAKRKSVPVAKQVNHKTPKQAGGCNNANNTIPDTYVPVGDCAEIERLQSELHGTRR